MYYQQWFKTKITADKLNTYQQQFKLWTDVDIWSDNNLR
jgi:hypothetical protein